MANRRLLLALLLSIACPVAWAQGPAGPEFQVNTQTLGGQLRPALALSATGDFVVVWQDVFAGIFGQRFDAFGVARGTEFRVNSSIWSYQGFPAVASDAIGNFVVVWDADIQDGSGYGVFGQRFDASGLPQGSEFQVNSYTTNYQRYPAVASGAGGNFVVVWQSEGQDGSGGGIFGQRFDAAGLAQGSEFPVNSFTTSFQRHAAVTSDPNGNFVVVWQSYGRDGSGYGVFGRRFNASGIPQGSEFQVNSYTTGPQLTPSVGSDANGNFVVVWSTRGYDRIVGQRFNASGITQGSEFQVNSHTTGDRRYPTVASDASGNFVVVWQSLHQDGSGFGGFGKRFDASGVPQSREFRVNSYTTGDQSSPSVASDANGNLIAVWVSYWQDGSSDGVFGRRYSELIFRDGFE